MFEVEGIVVVGKLFLARCSLTLLTPKGYTLITMGPKEVVLKVQPNNLGK